MNPLLREEDEEQHCGEITLLYCFIVVCSAAPVPTPTYFLGPRELTAPESQMNSTFLPSWAVTGPHTAEARLINETQQDVGSHADSYVWNEESDGDVGVLSRPLCSLSRTGSGGPRGGDAVDHNRAASKPGDEC